MRQGLMRAGAALLAVVAALGLAVRSGEAAPAYFSQTGRERVTTCTYPGIPIFNDFRFGGPEDPACGDQLFRLDDGAYPFESGTGANRVAVAGPRGFVAVQNLGTEPGEVGIAFFRSSGAFLGAACSGPLFPGAHFVTRPADLPVGTARAVVYSFASGPAAAPRCADLGTVIGQPKEFAALDAEFAAGGGGPPVGVVARTAAGCFANGDTAPHNLVGFPLVGRAFAGQGLRAELTVARAPESPGLLALAVFYYDGAGIHDYFCLELQPDETRTIDLEQYLRVPPGFAGSLIVAAFQPLAGGGEPPHEDAFRIRHEGEHLDPQGFTASLKLTLGADLDRFLGLPVRPAAPAGPPEDANRLGIEDPAYGGFSYYFFPVTGAPSGSTLISFANQDAELPASVDVWGFAAGSGIPRFARRLAPLAPGATVRLSAKELIRGLLTRFTGSIWVRSSRPLRVSTGSGDALVEAIPATVWGGHDELLFQFTPAAGTRLERSGFPRGDDMTVVVQNMSPVLPAKIQVSFVMDTGTARTFIATLPPQGVATYTVRRSVFAGRDVTVTVDSLPHFAPGGPLLPAPDVAGYAFTLNRSFDLEASGPIVDPH